MKNTLGQLMRYGTVGALMNGAAYLMYLTLTVAGMAPKLAMTLLYALGVASSFIFNRGWTFGHGGAVPGAMVRYIATYAIGYVFNLAALYVFSDRLGLPHQGVMLALIFVTAGIIFTLQKFWVFPAGDPPAPIMYKN